MHMEPPPPPSPTPPYTSSTSSTHPSDSHPTNQQQHDQQQQEQQQQQQQQPSRYEAQKRRDWNTFQQYLRNHKPPLALQRCSGAHVIEFLKYLDQFGKTKVHANACPFFGNPNPPSSCACPLKQAWGSLDALIGRLRAAYEESGGRPESNPFAARAVRIYLREVRESQAHARGIPYEKKKRKRVNSPSSITGAGAGVSSSSSSAATAGGGGGEGTGSSTSGLLKDKLSTTGAPT